MFRHRHETVFASEEVYLARRRAEALVFTNRGEFLSAVGVATHHKTVFI